MAAKTFLERLNSGEILISDGATGTNLQMRGLARGVSAELWVLEQPEQIERLHGDFLAAGANILLTCTFGGNSVRLEQAGLAGRVLEINRQAVKLARHAAAGSKALVAGSIGPTGHLMQPMGPMDEATAQASFAQQAKVLVESGVDLLVIETQYDLAEAAAAIRAVRSVTALPLVCSFSYDRGTRTMMGTRPAVMAREIGALGVDVLGINCGRSLDDNLKALMELRAATQLPIWFKPNAGLPVTDENGELSYAVTPADMGGLAAAWLGAGANVVGGCCGTSPRHLLEIAVSVRMQRRG